MIKLMIADDHVVLRQALCEMLQGIGSYEIIGQAADGEQLLELLKSQKPDLVIMDVTMPKLGGVEAISKMRQNFPEKTPVLILSADEGEKNVRAALKAGASGFMPKNAGLDELEFAIESILEGKTYLSPSVTNSLMSGGKVESIAANLLADLTKREVEILTHLADGH